MIAQPKPNRYIVDDYIDDKFKLSPISSSPGFLTWEDNTENILNTIQEIITRSQIRNLKKNVGIAPKASELKPIIRSNKERKKKKEDKIVLNKDLITEYFNDHPEVIKNYVISYLEKNLVDLREHMDKAIKNNIISTGVIKDYLKAHLKVDWVKMNVQDPNGQAWGATARYGIGIYLDDELISKTVMGLYL